MLTLGLVSITYRKLTPAEIIPLVRDAGLTVSSYGSYYRPGAGGPPLAVSREGIDVSRSLAYCQKASALADERSTNSRFL
jgi:hypothetical protein